MYNSAIDNIKIINSEFTVGKISLFDTYKYVSQLSVSPADLDHSFAKHYLINGANNRLHPHTLFDANFYLSKYKDVSDSNMNPLIHYIKYGARERRDPHPLFDTEYYLSQYTQDEMLNIENPLAHFLEYGCNSWKSPSPLFDLHHYVANYQDSIPKEINPLVEYLESGWKKGNSPHPLFNESYFLEKNPKQDMEGQIPLIYFVSQNKNITLSTSPFIDTNFYLENNPDVLQNNILPLIHYLKFGWREGRNPHPLFDVNYYLSTYNDVFNSEVEPYSHFIRVGDKEGRNPSKYFDTAYYRSQIAEADIYTNSLLHFISIGIRNNISPNRLIELSAINRGVYTDNYDFKELHRTLNRFYDINLNQVLDFKIEHDFKINKKLEISDLTCRQRTIFYEKTFCFITAVYDTDIVFLKALVKSLINQLNCPNFFWFILDNGSKNKETIKYVESLSNYHKIEYHRVQENLGIIGGMRYCLNNSQYDYVIPLDSDDILSEDCVEILNYRIKSAGYPDIIYTDEDKIIDNNFMMPFFKPEWDPVYFTNSCYIAHLTIVNRNKALELHCYTDSSVEGSHDWDTFTRFHNAGILPYHIDEVLYSWRIHDGSTSGNIGSKPYVFDSQINVLKRFLENKDSSKKHYKIVPSPLFRNSPDWWVNYVGKKKLDLVNISIFTNELGDCEVLQEAHPGYKCKIRESDLLSYIRSIAVTLAGNNGLLRILGNSVDDDKTQTEIDIQTLFSLYPDLTAVGGPIFMGDRVTSAGQIFGFGSGSDSPDRGRSRDDVGYYAQMFKQRTVSAVSVQNIVIKAQDLLLYLDKLDGQNISFWYLGSWIGAEAYRSSRRIVFSPYMASTAASDWTLKVSDVEKAHFVLSNRALMPDHRWYSSRFGLSPDSAYVSVDSKHRNSNIERLLVWARNTLDGAEHLMLASKNLLNSVSHRKLKYRIVRRQINFSILTTVYKNTDQKLFEELTDSISQQSFQPKQWIILCHGPVGLKFKQYLIDLRQKLSFINLFFLEKNLGIIGGMKFCLKKALGDYIIPIDADDLITPDALNICAHYIIKNNKPAFLYSNEAIYADNAVTAEYIRNDWDPVLALTSSTIWHLCVIRRDIAIRVGLYDDSNMNYAHDWDSILKIYYAKQTIIHVPEVLYFWRSHRKSLSNSRIKVNNHSLEATKYLLKKIVAKNLVLENFNVEEFPLFREAKEYYIKRLAVNAPTIDAVILDVTNEPNFLKDEMLRTLSCDLVSEIRHIQIENVYKNRVNTFIDFLRLSSADFVVVVDSQTVPLGTRWIWEAIGLLELHFDAVAVSGMTASENNVVINDQLVSRGGKTVEAGYIGLRTDNPGPFAMQFKSHSTMTLSLSLSILNREMFLYLYDSISEELFLEDLPTVIPAVANANKKRIIYTPLLQAKFLGGITNRLNTF